MIPIRQNVDMNAKASDFPVMKDDELLISPPFITIQGEGPFAGRRAYFIRASGCNFGGKDIACSWCDTNFKISEGKITKFSVLADQLAAQDADAPGRPIVVITGGEPLLQRNMPYFIEYLLGLGYVVQVETNGTFLHRLEHLAQRYVGLHIVCSPKQVSGKYASKPPTFSYTQSRNSVHFKFVVSEDFEPGHFQLPEWASSVDAVVWISPMTVYKKEYKGEVSSVWDSSLVDHELTSANYRYAAELVMANPRFRFTCQLHTLMAIA